MSIYKLIYFNLRGRGQSIRYLFAVADVKYEDVRIDRQSEWPQYNKESLPFGQVPVLEVDGQVFCQSHVIEQFLAKRFGLAGKTELEQARAAMVVACVDDLYQPVAAYLKAKRETEEDQWKKIVKKYKEEDLPRFLMMLDRMLGDKNYFLGDQMTYPDIVFTSLTDNLVPFMGNVVNWEKWLQLEALRNKVHSHPKIAPIYSKYPKDAI